MPFDVLCNGRLSLGDAATKLGIIPISNDFLKAHKEEQVRKHPGSFVYRHRKWFEQYIPMSCFFVGFAMVIVPAALMLAMIPSLSFLLLLGVLLLGMILVVGSLFSPEIKATGPAMWEETFGPVHDAPRVITQLAHQINILVPGSIIVTGKLMQNKVMLDPYMVVRHHGNEIVIGIWDGKRIIKMAEFVE